MILRYAIVLAVLLAVVLGLVAFAAWAFLPARHLPGNRARHLRIRLHLRLHPGKGFAHAFSLHLRWSRFAALRRSGRIRPSLPLRYRFLALATERHGSLASIPLDAVASISADLAPLAGLHPGTARAALRKAVLTARNGAPR